MKLLEMQSAIASNDINLSNKYEALLDDAEWCEVLMYAAKLNRSMIVSNLLFNKETLPNVDVVKQAMQIAEGHKNEAMTNALRIALGRKSPALTPSSQS